MAIWTRFRFEKCKNWSVIKDSKLNRGKSCKKSKEKEIVEIFFFIYLISPHPSPDTFSFFFIYRFAWFHFWVFFFHSLSWLLSCRIWSAIISIEFPFFEILNIHFLNDISSRRQQHYHSQRSARETRMSPPGGNAWSGSERPVSNYFEYESLHIAGHKVALSGPPYK